MGNFFKLEISHITKKNPLSAVGLLIGSMMGSFFLRSARRWPMFIGGGLGFGMAYTNCEHSLNDYLLSMDPKACVIKRLNHRNFKQLTNGYQR
ncbi:unnamed protein product [Chilo suppressalis]|uniref:MICOS complex subunit MIC10 n=1 Tax=Chilo suppressalis TaxID=168631 RepID=A0ABN8B2U4_CHISP|nr:unnamed protein product [Chilo suppressalis]